MKDKIILFHPCRSIGGTEILLTDTVLLYKENNDIDLYLVDYIDGANKKILDNSNIEYQFLNYFEKKIWSELIVDSIVFSTSRNLIGLYNDIMKIKKELRFKLFLWVLHPKDLYARFLPGYDKLQNLFGYNGASLVCKLYPFYRSYKKLLLDLDEKDILYFMDYQTLEETELMFDFKLNKRNILYFPAKMYSNIPIATINTVDRSKVAIVSRLDDMKVAAILKLMEDLVGKQKKIFIIGYGSKTELIKKYAIYLELDIIFLGEMNRFDIRNFLLTNNISLLYAMGMSIFEGISIGIPTIVLRPSEHKIEKNNVYYIFGFNNKIIFGEFYKFPSKINYLSYDNVEKIIENNWEGLSLNSLYLFDKNFSTNSFYLKIKYIVNNMQYISLSVDKSEIKFVKYLRCIFNIVQRLRNRKYDY
ncbi:glycosyltransferase [Acinetobacter ursingii]|uniref:glycosyltransferase n=1 Tax=Acinetobacter ursingii TaxID=108980 RepID=UPI003AF722F9